MTETSEHGGSAPGLSSRAMREALAHLPTGIAIFDDGQTLGFANDRFATLSRIPAAVLMPGCAYGEIAGRLGLDGTSGSALPDSGPVACHIGGDPAVDLKAIPTPSGGIVLILEDVSAREEAETALHAVSATLERRIADRTASLTRVNAELESERAKADAANRDKTRFLAAASHDLLQPLNAARLYTSTLIERSQATGLAELANAIGASLTAVEDIMATLVDISRLDSGAVRPVPAPFQLSGLLDKVRVEFTPLAREHEVELRIVPSTLAVDTDRALLARVLQNLVANAIKYTPAGGRVLVGARRRGNRVRIDVVDTGIGFSRDQHRLVFAEFSRLEQGARMAQGLGLGLSIVQRLVATLGLALDIDSRVGRGSRFSVLLSRSRRRPAPPSGPEPVAEPRFARLEIKVLCVDNEPSILAAMEGLLEHWGCEVRTALSLRQIDRERLLESWSPDLVLMDYHLDQTSGLDAIAWLRHNVGAHLPAALVTADRSARVRALAEERGVAVINKPVKPAALRATITGLAGRAARPD